MKSNIYGHSSFGDNDIDDSWLMYTAVSGVRVASKVGVSVHCWFDAEIV